MPKYTNPEMRKATQQLKEKPRKIKIISGSASTREPLATSSKRAKSMTSSGLPRTSRRATTSTTTPRKPLAKEVKIGKTKVKMVGGIVPVLSKPKKKMF